MAIKIAHLRTLSVVSSCGNIKDAAARLGRTPSAVSMALKQFEDELGGSLFEADRKTSLTPLGRFILNQANDALANYDRSVAAIQAYSKNEIGRLVVACVPSVAARLLPEIIRSFVAELPRVELEIQDMDSAAVLRSLRQGQVDLGIASLDKSDPFFEVEELFSDHFGVVVPAGHSLVGLGRAVRWEDLRGERLIANGLSMTLRDSTYRALEADSQLTVRNVWSLLALVKCGLGVTLLPHLSVPLEDPALKVLELGEGPLRRQVTVLRRAGETPSPVALLFTKKLAQEIPILRQCYHPNGH
ncbi:MAG: LysR substrate-binding domain-containing protein [Pseudomonadota bacterium]